jgi:hypothetical protein
MALKKALLIAGALLALAPSVVAEPMPLPLEPAVPGFNGDVEVALNDLTRLQCRLLGLVMINQPCPAR